MARPQLGFLCTKVRAFNALVLLCGLNVLLFRTFFPSVGPSLRRPSSSSRTTFPTSLFYDLGLQAGAVSEPLTAPSVPPPTSVSPSPAVTVTTTAVGSVSQVDRQAANSSEGTAGFSLEAFGVEVRRRANRTAPWAAGNASHQLCPVVPPKLVGNLATYTTAPNLTYIVDLNPGLETGGHYLPPNCRARSKVALIVPYRDREEHLRLLLHNLHPFLIRQQLDYFILVVELAQPSNFNRGMLLNIGSVEALGLRDVECFVFHDVDLVPENDHNLYTCPDMPRHLSAAIDKFGYKLPYQNILGGVTAIRRDHLFKINGYSNLYFGWGGEDDDLASRVYGSGLNITRYAMNIARYRMIKHDRDHKNEPNPKRFSLLKYWQLRHKTDGLNSLQYEVEKMEFRPGYTWLLVSINMQAVIKEDESRTSGHPSTPPPA